MKFLFSSSPWCKSLSTNNVLGRHCLSIVIHIIPESERETKFVVSFIFSSISGLYECFRPLMNQLFCHYHWTYPCREPLLLPSFWGPYTPTPFDWISLRNLSYLVKQSSTSVFSHVFCSIFVPSLLFKCFWGVRGNIINTLGAF